MGRVPPHRPASLSIEFVGALFDLDGTLIDSIAAVERSWTIWCKLVDLDPSIVVPQIHGRRALDSLRLVAPHLGAEEQLRTLDEIEAVETDGIVSIDGAAEMLSGLKAPWAIVTSGNRPVAEARIRASGLPCPRVVVCGDDVAHGKPAPDPYLLAASHLQVDPSDCIAFEDTFAGIASARTAGATVVAISAAPIADATATLPNFRGCEIGRIATGSRWKFTFEPDSDGTSG